MDAGFFIKIFMKDSCDLEKIGVWILEIKWTMK